MKVSVVGVGYVGLVVAGCLAEVGNHVICVDNDKKKINNWTVKSNPGWNLPKKRGVKTANFLIANHVNTLLTGEIGKSPFHTLRDNFIEIYEIRKEDEIKRYIEAFLNQRLPKLRSPKQES